MKMSKKIFDIKIIEKISRDMDIEPTELLEAVNRYYSEIKNELMDGNSVITGLGKFRLSPRHVNSNFGGIGITAKLSIDMDNDFKTSAINKFILDEEQKEN